MCAVAVPSLGGYIPQYNVSQTTRRAAITVIAGTRRLTCSACGTLRRFRAQNWTNSQHEEQEEEDEGEEGRACRQEQLPARAGLVK
jgi:hypothetical protein